MAILIRLDSPGSVFFIQNRISSRRRIVDGKEVWEVRVFPFFKFRSMQQNVDQKIHRTHISAYLSGELNAEEEIDTFKLKDDPRITKIGKFIRRTSIDELPQLFNVLRGEMSLVGPRPVPVYEYLGLDAWHTERLAALQGITGYWQIAGRGRVSFDEQIRMDIAYVRNQSFWLDIRILFLTVFKAMWDKNAY